MPIRKVAGRRNSPERLFVVLFLACACLPGAAPNLAASPLELAGDRAPLLYGHMQVLEDAEARLTPVQALAPEHQERYRSGFSRPPGFGMTPSAFWIRFSLRNDTDLPHWLLVLKLPRLESGQLYRLEEGNPRLIGRAGLTVPFEQRSYPHRDMIFRMEPEAGAETEYLLRVRNRVGPLVMPFRVFEASRFTMQDQWESILMGLYFGALLVMILYNLVLFFLLRDRTFLFYSLFVTCFGMLMVLSRGLHRPFFWNPGMSAEVQAIPVITHITLILSFVFMGSYFKQDGKPDRVARLIRVITFGMVLHLLLAFVLLYAGIETYMRTSFVVAMVVFPIPVFAVSLIRLRQGHSGAPYFVAGWAVLFTGGFSSMLVTRGYLPYNLLTYNGVLIASVLEMMLLSLGLTDRFRWIERESQRHRLASETKTRFLAHMSHEIRTPLNAVLGMSELLRETRLSGEQQKYLKVLSRAGRNLLEVINDILDISKIEAGHMNLEKIRFRPATLIDSIGELFAPEAKAQELELIARTEGDVPEFIYGDPTRLRQILSNLVSNAIKFTERGFIRVLVRPNHDTRAPEGTIRLEFEVEDSGIGIDLDKWELIFDSFAQADESTTRRFGGTGLGLSICRNLVELMGGRIGVESFPGKGSRFSFALLFETGDGMPVEGAASEDGAAPPTPARALRILLAEDNADNQLLFEAFLRKTEHKIDVAQDGEEAVRLFQTNYYDLVFMDIQMPILSGLEATERIRAWEERAMEAGARTKPVPIYALTAHALEHERRNSLDAGCDGHISKPLEKAVLLEVVRKYADADAS